MSAADQAGFQRRRHEVVVEVVRRAVAEVDDRLRRFHRSAIAKVRPDEDLLALGTHGESAFGLWYQERKDTPPVDQPAFETLVVLHEALLNHIALLAARAWKDDRVPIEEYDALLEKVTAFHDQARRLTRAFQAAISDIDPLTGTQTRQVMQRDLKREMLRARRSGTPGCLVLADIDRFKRINDTYGHRVGDQVLATVSALLIGNLRPYDSVYRYGGEEFLICLPETGRDEGRRVLERVRESIADAPIIVDGEARALSVTVSFGLAVMNQRHALSGLIEHADQALYAAKRGGRNRVEIWIPSRSSEKDDDA
ncbi:MAG: diguanylate cyclase [Alphaproteobacteria bacterium]|nr:diguanylate cyclase [Alphaproteobacteria bacterium]